MLRITDRGLDAYVRDLDRRTPFALSRWGDGEWMALLGMGGATRDGQTLHADLRAALTTVLETRPPYELALGPFAIRRFGPQMEQWLAARALEFSWTSAVTFAYASRDGRLGPLTRALSGRCVVLIGPAYLSALTLFPVAAHIVVPASEAFDAAAQIEHEAHTWLLGLAHRQPVAAISAGPAAKVLVHRLWGRCPFATVIDFGSVWDPYAGRITRTYQKGLRLCG